MVRVGRRLAKDLLPGIVVISLATDVWAQDACPTGQYFSSSHERCIPYGERLQYSLMSDHDARADYAEFITEALKARRKPVYAKGVAIRKLGDEEGARDGRLPHRDTVVFGAEHGGALFFGAGRFVQQGYLLITATLRCDRYFFLPAGEYIVALDPSTLVFASSAEIRPNRRGAKTTTVELEPPIPSFDAERFYPMRFTIAPERRGFALEIAGNTLWCE